MARPKAFDRDVALDAAIAVFREHGFEGTSAEGLVGAMGIGRQSLYDTFGDKWRLYCAAVERYCQAETQGHREALKTGPLAIDGVRAMLARVVAEADQACLGVGSICEFGRTREELTRVHDTAWRTMAPALLDRIRAAQAEGSLSAGLSPETAADFLRAHITGLRIAARGGADRDRLASMSALALRALQ